jgi:hypothetical protein
LVTTAGDVVTRVKANRAAATAGLSMKIDGANPYNMPDVTVKFKDGSGLPYSGDATIQVPSGFVIKKFSSLITTSKGETVESKELLLSSQEWETVAVDHASATSTMKAKFYAQSRYLGGLKTCALNCGAEFYFRMYADVCSKQPITLP